MWLIIGTWLKATFSWMKNVLFCTQFSPQNAGNHIKGFDAFLMEHALNPPRGQINAPLLIQSGTLFKPAGYFNYYWNPCILFQWPINLPFLGLPQPQHFIGSSSLLQCYRMDTLMKLLNSFFYKPPKTSLNVCAITFCWGMLQWFSSDKIKG